MMNTNGVFDHKIIDGFAPVLTYAACEWFLIFLMFIDALLSYLLVWFARYCRLQMPCFLCSKLLHPLPWRLLLCRNHRSEVSCFMSCHNHDYNLADCRGMCDDCLLSFTKTTGPNPDMNILLLGKLGYDLLSQTHFEHPRSCSCCNKPWRTRLHRQRMIRLGSSGRNSSDKPNIPAPRNRLTRRGSSASLKKMRRGHKATSDAEYVDIGSRSDRATSDAEYVDIGSRSDSMAHMGYAELKIHSGSESDFLFSDDDSFVHMSDFSLEPSKKKRVHKSRSRSRSRRSFEGRKMSSRKQPDLQENQGKNIHVRDDETVESSMPERNLGDKNRQQQPVETEEHEAVLTELVTMSEARPFSLGLAHEDNKGTSAQKENEAKVSGNSLHDGSADSDQNISSSAKKKMKASEEDMQQNMSEHVCVSNEEENGVGGVTEPLMSNDISDSLQQEPSRDEENEANEKRVVQEYLSNDEGEINGVSEPSTSKDVAGSFAEEQANEEDESNGYSVAKSHSSNEEDASNGESEPLIANDVDVDVSVTEEHSGKEVHVDHQEAEPLTSPKISNEESSLEHKDKGSSKVKETEHTSNRSGKLKHSASVESFGSISSDIEGESLINLLKQQLEDERKCLRELNKELEEERNASAIATDEAVGMITRLQEEKSALHTEALQYLRMMDEQAEHDVDALERANDALADKEKEIQDLEMELEYYRVKYPDEPREEILASMGILENTEKRNKSTSDDETSEKVPTDTKGSPSAGI